MSIQLQHKHYDACKALRSYGDGAWSVVRHGDAWSVVRHGDAWSVVRHGDA